MLRTWVCACDCGATTLVATSRLMAGTTRSCGCLQRDKARFTGIYHTQPNWPRVCLHCKQGFLGTRKQRFCTRACKEAYQLVPRQQWNCEVCGNPVRARLRQRYCSIVCKSRGRHRKLASAAAVMMASTKLDDRNKETT
jgi:hypothetical protein